MGMRRLWAALILAPLALARWASGQAPAQDDRASPSPVVVAADASPQQRVIPFQGLLTTPGGAPVLDGTYDLTFKLYGDANSVSPLGGWSETYNGLSVVGGRFSVLLGTIRSLDNPDGDDQTNDAIPFNKPVFLGIKVGADSEMHPRKQIIPAVHAYRATAADFAQSASFGGGIIGEVVMWAGSVDVVPVGWLPCDGRPLLKNDYVDLYAVISTAWGGDATHFNLPDLRGRFARGASGSEITGATGGQDQFSLPGHSHTVNAHTHGLSRTTGPISSDGRDIDPGLHAYNVRDDGNGWNTHNSLATGCCDNPEGQHYHELGGETAPAGTSTATSSAAVINTVPKYAVVQYIIRAK